MTSPSKTLPAAPVNSFKRLAIGDTFTAKEGRFRKVGGRTAFKLLPSGTGQTHARVRFARSHAVTLDKATYSPFADSAKHHQSFA